jgi:hypothetical protein
MAEPQEELKDTYSAFMATAGTPMIIQIPNTYIQYDRDDVITYTMALVKKFRNPEFHSVLTSLINVSSQERMRRFITAIEQLGAPEEWYLLSLDGVIEQLLTERRININDYINLVDYILLRFGNYVCLHAHFLWKYIMYPLIRQHVGAGPRRLPLHLAQVMERCHPLVPAQFRLELQRWRIATFALPKPGVQAALTNEGGCYLHPTMDTGCSLDSPNVYFTHTVGRTGYLELAHEIYKQKPDQDFWLVRQETLGIYTDSVETRPPLFEFLPTFQDPKACEGGWEQVVVDAGLPCIPLLSPDFPVRADSSRDEPLAGEPRIWTQTKQTGTTDAFYDETSVAVTSSSSSQFTSLAARRSGVAPIPISRTIYPGQDDQITLTYDEEMPEERSLAQQVVYARSSDSSLDSMEIAASERDKY